MDGMLHGFVGSSTQGDAAVAHFALQVVSRVAGTQSIESGPPRRELLQLMVRLARTGDGAVMERLLLEMKRQRVSAERVVDIYIPAAVRQLGSAWHEGELNVLQTTVATARLQALLRELGRAWEADHSGWAAGGRILLIVPEREQHTLGAIIAAHQMRRLGISVNVQLLPTAAQVARLLNDRFFDAAFFSVAGRSALETCRELVNTVRQSNSVAGPIVIGGALVAIERGLAEATGADMATDDVTEALAACGLHARDQAAQ